MNCLWLTLADPDPADNGQYIYSGGLIRGIAALGAQVHVAGLRRPGSLHRHKQREGRITWHLAEHNPRSRWASLASPLPHIASRTNTSGFRSVVGELLDRNGWDIVVIDSINTAWALPMLQARGAAPPVLVYVAHNHEQGVARRQAADEKRRLIKVAKRYDSLKTQRLERWLVRSVDLVTANTLEDQARFAAVAPDKHVIFLPPTYDGKPVLERTISDRISRRAIIVGSFDWMPKRLSLEAFLAVADGAFASAGIGLDVVGNVPPDFLARLREKFRHTRFTGRVDDVVPYMADARVALVPDHLGGFKLKSLDYVFNRLPIIGIEGSVPGLPLRSGETILLSADYPGLVRTVIDAIDDFERLNRIQDAAFAACANRFDSASVCRRLIDSIAAVRRGGAVASLCRDGDLVTDV